MKLQLLQFFNILREKEEWKNDSTLITKVDNQCMHKINGSPLIFRLHKMMWPLQLLTTWFGKKYMNKEKRKFTFSHLFFLVAMKKVKFRQWSRRKMNERNLVVQFTCFMRSPIFGFGGWSVCEAQWVNDFTFLFSKYCTSIKFENSSK